MAAVIAVSAQASAAQPMALGGLLDTVSMYEHRPRRQPKCESPELYGL